MTWMLTNSGRRIDFPTPDPSQICLEDIATHLSRVPRFAGATETPYSVAQHSIYVSHLVPEEHQLQALLHDAAEAYCCDLPTPLKSLLPEYKAIEQGVWRVISGVFSVDSGIHPVVKEADRHAYLVERHLLLPDHPDLEELPEGFEVDRSIDIVAPHYAAWQFLQRYEEITGRYL